MNQERIAFLAANIREARKAANDVQITDGTDWYPHAHNIARDSVGNGDVRKGAGILAALSPRVRWERNVELAIVASHGVFGGCLSSSIDKARAIYNGADPADVLPMPRKTGHFFRNIMDPYDPDACTIDVWAYRAAMGDAHATGPKSAIDYAECVAAYGIVADEFGELRNVTQAIVWGVVREGWLS